MSSTKQAASPKPSQLGEKLLTILSISQKINAERDLPTLLALIAREAARLLEADRSSIFLLDREKCELWSQVAMGSEERLRFDARLGLAGAAALTGETVNVEDAHQDPRFYPGIDAKTRYRTRSVLVVPLRNYEREIVGAFQVMNKKGGAFDEDDEQILKALAAHAAIAIETAQLVGELREHRDQLLEENTQLWKDVEGRFSAHNILGTSEKIQFIVRLIEQISDTSVNVLITGENGTGKELVAKAVHYNSPRARQPFIALNCAALPENLVESELFGIEKGVATGVDRRIGKFEDADGGTLFLDEIGDLTLVAQAKILRALQERVIERVGGRRTIPVDARILAATNKNLEAEIKKGHFREDLFYRLKVIHLQTPPLREIQQDIPLLANYFLAKYCQEMNRDPKKISAGAMKWLVEYRWPGNVRQLENEMKRLAVTTRRTSIVEEDLPEAMRSEALLGASGGLNPASLKEAVDEAEKRVIRHALESCGKNQVQAAKLLGLSRQGLIKKMKRFGIR